MNARYAAPTHRAAPTPRAVPTPVPCNASRRRASGEFHNPCGLAVDVEKNHLYVADSGNHRLAVYSEKGKSLWYVGSKGGRPRRRH